MAVHTLARSVFRHSETEGERCAPPLTIAQIYETHFHYVWRCMRGLGVRDDAIEDAVHDVFLVVHRKLHQFDGNVRLTTWLYAIALRVARRYRSRAAEERARHASSAQEGGDETESADSRADVEEQLEANQRLALARRALDALDEDKREAFVLSCVEQLPAPEISSITGVPVNTVYSRIRAARRAFSAELARLQSVRRSR